MKLILLCSNRKDVNTIFDSYKYLGINLEVFTISSFREKLNSVIKNNFSTPVVLKAVIGSKPNIYRDFVFFDIRDEKKNMQFTVMSNISIYKNIENKLRKLGLVEELCMDLPVMLILEAKVSTTKQISFRFSLLDIVPEYTSSILESKLDETINRLKNEELYDLQKKIPFPFFPRNIALLTSSQGTSVQDILSALGKTNKFFNIFFISVRVEGIDAVKNISNAIKNLNQVKGIDLIIVARGGGSSSDLSVFNDYELCKAVCLSKIPIITSIGHEKDVHAIELCSNYTPQPSTPSGLGHFLKNHYKDIILEFENINYEISTIINNHLTKELLYIRELLKIINLKIKNTFSNNLLKYSNLLDLFLNLLNKNKIIFFKINLNEINNFLKIILLKLKNIFSNIELNFEHTQKFIEANSSKNILKKGYVIVTNTDKFIINSIKKVKTNMTLNFYDGTTKVKLEEDLHGK